MSEKDDSKKTDRITTVTSIDNVVSLVKGKRYKVLKTRTTPNHSSYLLEDEIGQEYYDWRYFKKGKKRRVISTRTFPALVKGRTYAIEEMLRNLKGNITHVFIRDEMKARRQYPVDYFAEFQTMGDTTKVDEIPESVLEEIANQEKSNKEHWIKRLLLKIYNYIPRLRY